MESERDLAGDAQWKLIQKNCFTRWVNEHLKTVNKHISDLSQVGTRPLRRLDLIRCAGRLCCKSACRWLTLLNATKLTLRVPQRGTVFLSHSETRQSEMPASDGI